ncbi:MAG: hypothetical protein ACO3JL_09400 [Myxococcota bacterium]
MQHTGPDPISRPQAAGPVTLAAVVASKRLPPASPASALSLHGGTSERSEHDLSDAVIARLVHRRLELERTAPWWVLTLLVGPIGLSMLLGLQLSSPTLVAATATMAATLGIGLSFCVDRALQALYVREGRALGISESTCRRLFERSPRASHLLQVMASCGRVPSDAELASFVR